MAINNDATLEGSAKFVQDAQRGGVMSLDGFNDSLTVAHSPELEIAGSFTISSWLNGKDVGTANASDAILVKGSGFQENYALYINGGEISFGFGLGNGPAFHTTSGANLQANTWYNIVGVFDNVNNRVKIYVNGTEVLNEAESRIPAVTGEKLNIGKSLAEGNRFNGKLDDMRIYDQALTAEQVQQLARDENPAVTPVARYAFDEAAGSTIARDTAESIVPVPAPNAAPNAANDTITVAEDTSITFDPRANDSDPDGDALTIIAVGAAAHGTAAINAAGTLTYTPAANYFGADTFSYTVSDGKGGTKTATVNVNVTDVPEPIVNRAPDAVNDAVSVDEDKFIRIANPRANDRDPDGDPLTITAVGAPANGTATLNPADGSILYIPNPNFAGTDRFTYTITDGKGGFDTATITVTVRNLAETANRNPDAVDDAVTMNEDTSVRLNVLLNDKDPDGNPLKIVSLGTSTNGTVTLNADGTVNYTPRPDFSGTDAFSYRISDYRNGSDIATVRITVRAVADNPDAVNDTVTVDEDVSTRLLNLLANDKDADGNAIRITAVTQPAHGTVVLGTDGIPVYRPAPNYAGSDSFTYTITDGTGRFDTATVTINVRDLPEPNRLPDAVNDTITIDEDTSLVISNLLANDTDADGDALTITAVGNAAHGTAVLNANGTITYTPVANYAGPDSFTYTISDGKGGQDTATVNITVRDLPEPNRAPDAVNDAITVDEDTSIVISNLLANDTDADGDALRITAVGSAAHGTVVLNANGTITYTPTANYAGPDSFTYTITDGKGGTDTASVNITVRDLPEPNRAPDAVNDSVTMDEDTAITLSSLRANDTDPDGDALTITAVGNATNGTASLNLDGTVTFTPNANYAGPASFTYTISDGKGGSDTATVNLTVRDLPEPNRAPDAVNDSVTMNEDTSVTLSNLKANDTDPDGDALSITAVGNATNGTVALNTNGTVTFTPTANFAGQATFTYTVSDGRGGQDTATVTVNVVDQPETPANILATVVTATGQTINFTSIEAALSQAPSGSTITIKPGTYDVGGVINGNNVTLNATGVHFQNVAVQGKAAVVVNGRDVTINGLEVSGIEVADENGAAIRAQGFNLTLNGVHFHDNQEGVLGSGGTIRIVDSLFERNGFGGQAHQIYYSNPSTGSALIIEHSKFIDAVGEGHGVKSRAALTEIRDSVIASPIGEDSRAVDISEGGRLIIERSVIEEGPNSSNSDVIGYGFEGKTYPVNEVIITDSLFINDNQNRTPKWLGMPGTYGVTPVYDDNVFVGGAQSAVPGADSQYFASRAAAGLPAFPFIPDSPELAAPQPNRAPDAVNDAITVDEDTTNRITTLKNNDTDPDGNALTITAVGTAAHGTVTLNADGTITYVPTADYFGPDSFTYTISDGRGGSDTATVNVTVRDVAEPATNRAPDAVNDSVTMNEDTSITLSNLRANDTDPDGDALAISGVGNATNGTVLLNANGTVTFTPTANFAGQASFTYTVSDGRGGQDTATVNVTVVDQPETPAGGMSELARLAANLQPGQFVEINTNMIEEVYRIGPSSHHLAGGYAQNMLYYKDPVTGKEVAFFTGSDHNGETRHVQYNISTNTWETLATPPFAGTPFSNGTGFNPVHAYDANAIDQVNGIYYTAFPYNSLDAYAYNIATNTWSKLPRSPDANSGLTSAATVFPEMGNKLVVVNGSEISAYNPATNSWSSLGRLPADPGYHIFSEYLPAYDRVNADGSVTHIGGQIIVGGGNGGATGTNRFYAIDAQGNINQFDAPFELGVSRAIIVQEPETHTVLAFTEKKEVWSMDPETHVWTKLNIPNVPFFGAGGGEYETTSPATFIPGLDVIFFVEGSRVYIYKHAADNDGTQPTPQPNRAPDAVNDAITVDEDSSNRITTLKNNDTDADGNALTITAVTQGAHGAVTLNADGTVTYVPAANYFGPDSFTYTISDGRGGQDTATVNVTVRDVAEPVVNRAPDAINDSVTMNEDTSVTLSNLRANDTDPDGDALTISGVGNATNGTVLLNANGTVTFTPTANFAGQASFTYTVSDGRGGQDTATVNVTVVDQPETPASTPRPGDGTALGNLAASLQPGQFVELTTSNLRPVVGVGNSSGHIFGGYTDNLVYDDKTNSIFIVASDHNSRQEFVRYNIGNNTWEALPRQSWMDSPNGQGGHYTQHGYDHNVIDGNGNFYHYSYNSRQVHKYNTTTGVWTDVAVIPNSVDSSKDITSGLVWDPGRNRLLLIEDNQIYSYNPATNGWANLATFPTDYGYHLSAEYNAQYNITIFGGGNGFTNVFYKLDANGVISRIADSPVPLGVSRAELTVDPVTGRYLAFTGGRDVYSYDPATNTWAVEGIDVPFLSTNSGTVNGAVATVKNYGVNFLVDGANKVYLYKDDGAGTPAPANQAPDAVNDAITVDEDSSNRITTLKANDTDANGDALTITAVGTAAHGTVTLNADGTINYTPTANYFGPDSFTYTISDGRGGSDTATVNVTVRDVAEPATNRAPDAVNDSVTMNEDTSITLSNLKANDTDLDGDALSISGVGSATNGTVLLNANGTVTFTPTANFAGQASFTYTVSDGRGGQDTATVNVTVVDQPETPTPTPTPDGDTVVGFQLQNNTATTEESHMVTFGQVFVAGDVMPGTKLFMDVNGTQIPVQMDVKATNPDGSVRHALLTFDAPSMPAGQKLDMLLKTGGAGVAGPAIAAQDIVNDQNYDVQVKFTMQDGTVKNFDVQNLLSQSIAAGKVNSWMSGANASEFRVEAAVTDHLQLRIDVRMNADGTHTTNVSMSNDWTFIDTMGTYNYNVEIKDAGQVAFTDSVAHHRNSTWHKEVGNGEGDQHLVRDVDYMIKSGSISSYDTSIKIDTNTINSIYNSVKNSDTGPMGGSILNKSMPDTGESMDIGLRMQHTVMHLLAQTEKTEEILYATADAGGSIPWHFRDEATGEAARVDHHGVLTTQVDQNQYFGNQPEHQITYNAESSAGGWIVDDAHQPSVFYVPYLLSGERYYADELALQANYNIIRNNPAYRDDTNNIVYQGQVRGIAWNVRTLSDASFILPDNSAVKEYLKKATTDNVEFLVDRLITSGDGDARGQLEGALDPFGRGNFEGIISPWMDDFFRLVFSEIGQRGSESAKDLVEYAANLRTLMLTADDLGFAAEHGPAYHFEVEGYASGSSTPTPYTTIAQALANSDEISANDGILDGYSDSAGSYAGQARGAVAAIITTTNGQDENAIEAYGYIIGETHLRVSDLDDNPKYAGITPIIEGVQLRTADFKVLSNTAADNFTGTDKNELIHGKGGNDTLRGGNGIDLLFGGLGDDIVYGDAGNDHVHGNQGNDTLYGGDGNDVLNGKEGIDRLYGDAGNDKLYADGQDTLIDGGLGIDTLAVQMWRDHDFNLTDGKAKGIEVIDLENQLNTAAAPVNEVTLNIGDVLDMSDNDTLKILGDANFDRVTFTGTATRLANVTSEGHSFAHFEASNGGDLLVEIGLRVNGQIVS